MTRRARVATALRHEAPDAVPWQVELTSGVASRLVGRLGIAREELDEWAGNHCAKISLTGGELSADGLTFRDEFGVEWDRGGLDKDIGIIRRPLLGEPTLAGFRLPEIDEAAVRKRLDRFFAQPADRFVFAKLGTTLFERAWSFCGLEHFLVYLVSEPEFVARLLAMIAEYNEQLVEIALDYPVDGVYLGDDYGQQSGMIMSPVMWREHFAPHLGRLFARVRSAGRLTALHSCGNISAILDDLVELGLDVYQTVQPELYDLADLKSRYAGRLAFWGAISTQRDLPFLAPHDVRAVTRRTLAVLGAGGGYIAGPTHRVPDDVGDESIIALVEELNDQ